MRQEILAVYNPFGFSPLAQESVQYLQSIAIMLTRVHHSVQEVMSQTNEMTNRKKNSRISEKTNERTTKQSKTTNKVAKCTRSKFRAKLGVNRPI